MTNEERLTRVDAALTGQLRRSIELNARMITRLQRLARGASPEHAEQLLRISHDQDPEEVQPAATSA